MAETGDNQLGKKGRWRDVFRDAFLVILLVCAFRWAVAEPFLVPSGSMIPTLLIKDYIFVTKFSYGLRIPFMKQWILGPYVPQRGDVVVFRSKDDNFYFLVKRVVGLPGDKIVVSQGEPRLTINGKPEPIEDLQLTDDDFRVFNEDLEGRQHMVQYREGEGYSNTGEYTVPAGHISMMGDNRDMSSDSRVWGALPIENVLGKAQFIWMSCDEDTPAGSILCLDEHLRRSRFGQWID
jgi:signal peptidase I